MSEHQVGGDVLAYCTKCKMDLNHNIIAMKRGGDKIAKVECKTCNKTHIFREPRGITEPPKKKATRKTKATTAETVEAEWKRLMAASEGHPTKPYAMTGGFNLGDKIGHGKFGEGIVGKLIFPNKIEVIFQQDVKVLIHGGPPAPVEA